MPRLNNPNQTNYNVTRKLDEALRENYPYKYEIVPFEVIQNNKGKYTDTSVYKYALLNSLDIRTSTTTTTFITPAGSSSVSPSARHTYIDFVFYDRTTKKRYPETGNSSTRLNFIVAALTALIQKARG